MKCLLRNDFIDGFRKPHQPGYGPHLGFDYRKFEDYIKENFIQFWKSLFKNEKIIKK